MYFGSKAVDYDESHLPDKMFDLAIEQAKKALANSNYEKIDCKHLCFIFEYCKTPRQNTLKYDRVPKNNLMLLDVFVNKKPDWQLRDIMAIALDFETPQIIYEGDAKPSQEMFDEWLKTQSSLGGTTIEGVVIKNYNQQMVFAGRSQPMFAKFVREEFKELNKQNWGDGIPMMERLFSPFAKEPRWEKVIQHAREEGKLLNQPKDIGFLLPEIEKDFEEECEHLIKNALYGEYRREFLKRMTNGFAQFYKQKLLDSQLKEKGEE